MANTHGPGSRNRKRKFVRPIATAEKRIADSLPRLVDRLVELANGITIQQEDSKGPEVYTLLPNRQAAQYLVNRILGQPSQQMEMSGPQTKKSAISYDFETLKKMDTDELLRLHRETLGE